EGRDGRFLDGMAVVGTPPQPRRASGGRPLASGPFQLSEWKPGQALVLSKNPHYRDPRRPLVDRVVVRLGVSPEAAVLSFLGGELDVDSQLNSTDYIRFAQTPAWQPYLERAQPIVTYHVAMNLSPPPLGDRRVREALNLAVRRDDLVRLSNGRFVMAAGPLPPSLAHGRPAAAPPPWDPARARRLLDEAGVPRGQALELLVVSDAAADRLAPTHQADPAAGVMRPGSRPRGGAARPRRVRGGGS